MNARVAKITQVPDGQEGNEACTRKPELGKKTVKSAG